VPVNNTMPGRQELTAALHSLRKRGVEHVFKKSSAARSMVADASLRFVIRQGLSFPKG
jgi:hypothetical protein